MTERAASMLFRPLLLCFGCMILPGALLAVEPEVDFDRDILPILSDHCFQCHGPDEQARQADLRLDTQAGLLGDGSSSVVQPGDSQASELTRRIVSTDPDEFMPPEGKPRVTAAQVELLSRWIDQGAKWSAHWAWQAPRRPELPHQEPSDWPRNAIDHFVLDRMTRNGLAPSREASRETLIRRATLDLIGLPPTPEEIDAFLADDSPDAWERLIDRLLHSPAYGERMAWDWLDAARFSDTNGFQGDPQRTMWPWRDWVVRAFQENMPYDQFTIEQLAGDLLPDATVEQRLASGFNRNNMHNGEGGRIAEETRVENVFDRVETTATIWLGATFTCCRCHDHKYDPFTLDDYYGLYDIFNQISETGGSRSGQDAPVMDMLTDEERNRIAVATQKFEAAVQELVEFGEKHRPWQMPPSETEPTTDVETQVEKLLETLAQSSPDKWSSSTLADAIEHFARDERHADYTGLLKQLEAAIKQRDNAQRDVTRVMIMDQLEQPRETFILVKGAYDKPTDQQVIGATPAVLNGGSKPPMQSVVDAHAQPSSPSRASRLDLARWLVDRDNPLTARVTVNRFWQSIFGIGLVKTVEDFGVQGEKPSHPELLDWLAVEFMESGWDVKALHRLILTSATYRESSQVSAELLEADPDNRWLARGARFRLPSWMLRDAALAAGGLLVTEQGGPAVKPYQPEGIWEEATFGKIRYVQDHGAALYRRSLYIFWRRIVGPTLFFDNAARQTCTVKQIRTNTPLQALVTLNDITWVEAARALAQRVMLQEETPEQQIESAFRIVTARRPTDRESSILSSRFAKLRAHYKQDDVAATQLLAVGESPVSPQLDVAEHAAMTALCQLLLNLDEAMTKE